MRMHGRCRQAACKATKKQAQEGTNGTTAARHTGRRCRQEKARLQPAGMGEWGRRHSRYGARLKRQNSVHGEAAGGSGRHAW